MFFRGDVCNLRRWMYIHKDSEGNITKEFINGLEIFMYQAGNTQLTLKTDKMLCPCWKRKNTTFALNDIVWNHLLNKRFTPNPYYIWFQHGEAYGENETNSSNSNFEAMGRE